MAITTKVLGTAEVIAHLKVVPPALQTRIREFVADRMLSMRDGTLSNILSMFRALPTGLLYRGVKTRMDEESGARISGVVYIEGAEVPYAEIQERGGRTSAHDIRPKKPGGALAFLSAGIGAGPLGFAKGGMQQSMVIVKAVHHPGSNIPEHPYMRFALARETPIFTRGMRAIVDEVTRGGPRLLPPPSRS